MAGSARIGQFTIVTSTYGAPVAVAKPADNSPTPTGATAPSPTAAQLDALYQQLKAAATK